MKSKFIKLVTVIVAVFVVSVGVLNYNTSSVAANETFRFGAEVLIDSYKNELAGKRVGLVTNPTGVDQNLNSIVDILFEDPDIDLRALYGPEHGVRGNAQAGSSIASYVDPVTGLTVYSLYGSTRKPTAEMLEDIDVILFDIQDAGVTYYTYVWSLYYVMESAAENGKQVIVLDRPNPLGGELVAGPVEVESGQSSFVGLKDLAVVHGMTFGEIAQYFNGEFDLGADLKVIEMANYDPSLKYDDLGVFFVMPSPNMPTTDTVDVYPMTGFFETFSNVSEGRGTTKPFELIGAEFIDSTEYAKELNSKHLPGVIFRAAAFTPATGQKLAGKLVQGVEVYITNTDTYDPIKTGLTMIQVMDELYPGELVWRADQWLAKLTGKSYIEEDLRNGVSVDDIIATWESELDTFKEVREQYLIYPRSGSTPVVPIITYSLEASDFELTHEEAQDISSVDLIEKAGAVASADDNSEATVEVKNHTIEANEGTYTIEFMVSQDNSITQTVEVKVLAVEEEDNDKEEEKEDNDKEDEKDEGGPVVVPGGNDGNGTTTGGTPNSSTPAANLPSTGVAMISVASIGAVLMGLGYFLFKQKRNNLSAL